MDHRGHGRGLRDDRPFRLEDCADDVAAVADQLGIERMIVVGYSMGGPIAQLLWRRHSALVDGLVLCSTGAAFASTPRLRALFRVAGGLSATGASAAVELDRERGTRRGREDQRAPGRRAVGCRADRDARLAAADRGRSPHRPVRRPRLDRFDLGAHRRGGHHRGRRGATGAAARAGGGHPRRDACGSCPPGITGASPTPTASSRSWSTPAARCATRIGDRMQLAS